MNLTEDQKKDLRPFKVMELTMGAHIYVMNPDKSFDHMQIERAEMQVEGADILKWLCEKSKQKRLFTRINKPWHSFSGKCPEKCNCK